MPNPDSAPHTGPEEPGVPPGASPSDTTPAGVVEYPEPNASVHHDHLELRGSVWAVREVSIRCGGFSQSLDMTGQGAFACRVGPLSPGQNTIELRFTPEGEGEQATWTERRVIRFEEPFLGAKQRLDPLTHRAFQSGDPVMRCLGCYRYHLSVSWRDRHRCCLCGYDRACGPQDARFYPSHQPQGIKADGTERLRPRPQGGTQQDGDQPGRITIRRRRRSD